MSFYYSKMHLETTASVLGIASISQADRVNAIDKVKHPYRFLVHQKTKILTAKQTSYTVE